MLNQAERSRAISGDPTSLSIAVGIPTVGRPCVVTRTVAELRRQTRRPDAIFICAPQPEDLGGLADLHPDVRILTGPRGLPHQRNAIMRALGDFDAVIFIDDDFLPAAGYVASVEAALAAHPDIVMTTGTVVADGILGPGLDFEAARSILDAAGTPGTQNPLDVYNGYGCNMAVRLDPVRRHALTFDEGLPLYAWLEDVDFSRSLSRFGRVVKLPDAQGVHLGVKSGRGSGVRLGYSQIANPLYLARKGTCSWSKALFLMSRNCAANLGRSLHPEPHVDRIGRAIGNGRAMLDLVTGRLSPSRILSF